MQQLELTEAKRREMEMVGTLTPLTRGDDSQVGVYQSTQGRPRESRGWC